MHESTKGNILKVKHSKDNGLKPVWMTSKIQKSIKNKCNLCKKFLIQGKVMIIKNTCFAETRATKYSRHAKKEYTEDYQTSVDQIQSIFGIQVLVLY